MAKYEIISPGYLGRSSDVNAARCVNLYPELHTVDSKSAGSLIGTPVLLLFIDTLLGLHSCRTTAHRFWLNRRFANSIRAFGSEKEVGKHE